MSYTNENLESIYKMMSSKDYDDVVMAIETAKSLNVSENILLLFSKSQSFNFKNDIIKELNKRSIFNYDNCDYTLKNILKKLTAEDIANPVIETAFNEQYQFVNDILNRTMGKNLKLEWPTN